MSISSSHYSYATDPVEMYKWASEVARNITKMCRKIKMQPVFYGTGISGISSIIAISQKLQAYKNFGYGYVLIRKNADGNHNRSKYESCFKDVDISSNPLWIFVDDFLDTGLTLSTSIKFVRQHMEYNKFPVDSKGELMFIGQARFVLVSSGVDINHLVGQDGNIKGKIPKKETFLIDYK